MNSMTIVIIFAALCHLAFFVYVAITLRQLKNEMLSLNNRMNDLVHQAVSAPSMNSMVTNSLMTKLAEVQNARFSK